MATRDDRTRRPTNSQALVLCAALIGTVVLIHVALALFVRTPVNAVESSPWWADCEVGSTDAEWWAMSGVVVVTCADSCVEVQELSVEIDRRILGWEISENQFRAGCPEHANYAS